MISRSLALRTGFRPATFSWFSESNLPKGFEKFFKKALPYAYGQPFNIDFALVKLQGEPEVVAVPEGPLPSSPKRPHGKLWQLALSDTSSYHPC